MNAIWQCEIIHQRKAIFHLLNKVWFGKVCINYRPLPKLSWMPLLKDQLNNLYFEDAKQISTTHKSELTFDL